MPRHVVTRLAEALDAGLAAPQPRGVLVIGLAYKKNVPDIPRKPLAQLIELIEGRAAARPPITIPSCRRSPAPAPMAR